MDRPVPGSLRAWPGLRPSLVGGRELGQRPGALLSSGGSRAPRPVSLGKASPRPWAPCCMVSGSGFHAAALARPRPGLEALQVRHRLPLPVPVLARARDASAPFSSTSDSAGEAEGSARASGLTSPHPSQPPSHPAHRRQNPGHPQGPSPGGSHVEGWVPLNWTSCCPHPCPISPAGLWPAARVFRV